MNPTRRNLMKLASECFVIEMTARELLHLPIDHRNAIAADAGLSPDELVAALHELRAIEDARAEARVRDIEQERKERHRAATALRLVSRDD